MVVCKYFQQGSCRFGQYCRYEHINNYGTNTNRTKPFDGKNIALLVAEDILAAERGGQWLLSCFGPFKEQPSIPGMSDLSPEEVRWEMYQAEKTGNVEQVKVQFQQLCQDMKVKRDALKNPTSQLVTMLENLQKNNQESTFGASTSKSSFAFGTPQLGNTTTSSSNSNVFGKKPFGGSGNPFGGSFSSTNGSSIFGGSSATNSGSVFGQKPAFGNNSVFGSTPSSTSLFGASSTPAFGTQATLTSQSSSVFGGSGISQPVFGQTSAFGTSQNNSFLRPAAVPTSSVFGNNTTNTFGGSAPPSFGNPGIFGNAGKSSAFGGTTAENTSVFGQAKAPAFGTAPVFGGTSTFGAAQPVSIFGGQPTFGSTPATTNSMFGGSTTTTSVFNSPSNIFGGGAQSTPFGSTPTSFGQTTVASTPFGQPVSSSFGQTTTSEVPFGQTTTAGASFGPTTASSGTPFGQAVSTTNAPFGQTGIPAAPFAATSGPFGAAPFSQSTPFGQTVTATESSSTFGTIDSGFVGSVPAATPFGSQINFGSVISSPFANTNTITTVTTVASNPFTSAPQVTSASFGNPQQTQSTFAGSTSGPFTKSILGAFSVTAIVDESIFTAEGLLTDDEKSFYLQEKFILGKIPLRAPTKELR